MFLLQNQLISQEKTNLNDNFDIADLNSVNKIIPDPLIIPISNQMDQISDENYTNQNIFK